MHPTWGTHAKVPMWPIIGTTSLELLHVDFTSIEMTMELNQPPNMVNVLVFCDHFMKPIMAYMTPVQSAKTVAQFLWQGYIPIFGVLAKLLSDWDANFESNIVQDLCDLMGIWKVRTSPYHGQTNGQIEWADHMLMCMIGKLSKDQKVDGLSTYQSWYSPHYLMFGCWPWLSVSFYFRMMRGTEKHQCVDYCIVELHKWLKEAFKEVQAWSTSEAERQKQYYDRKANAISLEPGDLVLAKANAYKRKRKVKDWWEEEPYKLENQFAEGVPSYLVKNQWTGCSQVLHQNWLFLITPAKGTSLCTAVWAEQARCTTTALEEQTAEGSETEEAPLSMNCLPPTQQQTVETLLGRVNRRLCVFLQMFTRASLLDQGWKFDVEGPGVCRSQHWLSGGRGIDHTNEAWRIWPTRIITTLPLFMPEIASLKLWGVWNGSSSLCINFRGSFPSSTLMPWELLMSPCKGPHTIFTLPNRLIPCSKS